MRTSARARTVALEVTADVLREVRKAKSQAQVKMRAPVRRVLVRDTAERLPRWSWGPGTCCEAGSIERMETARGRGVRRRGRAAPEERRTVE